MKYNLYEYWEHAIFNKNKEVWSGIFDQLTINKDTVFLNVIIVNSYSNQHENSWIAYPNVYAALGFIKYIYLPTSVYGFFEKEAVDAGRVIEEDMRDYLQYQLENNQTVPREIISELLAIYHQLDMLFSYSENECFDKLKQIGIQLYDLINSEDYAYFYYYLFSSTKEVGEFLVDSYTNEEMLGIKTFEDEIGLSKEEWIKVTSQVYENEFMKRKFTDILTNRLGHSL